MDYVQALSHITKKSFLNTTTTIGNDIFKFTFVLFNYKSTLPLNYKVIKSLSLHDNLLSWHIEGEARLNNPSNCIENAKDPFTFVGGGMDFLFLEITPKGMEGENMSFRRLFSIYDFNDEIPRGDDRLRLKHIKFRDASFEYLSNINTEWSTTHALKRLYPGLSKKPLSQLKNSERSIYTGDAIKDLLQSMFSYTTVQFSDFDRGATKIFVTPSMGSTAIEVLDYILQRHVSEKTNEPCLLKIEGNNPDHWSLKPLSTYFKLANIKIDGGDGKQVCVTGPKCFERFTVSSHSNDTMTLSGDSINMNPRPSFIELDFPEKGTISSHKLNYLSTDRQARITSTSPVHTYDKGTGTFAIHGRDNNTNNYDSFFRYHFIDEMFVNEDTGGSRVCNVPSSLIRSVYTSHDDDVHASRNDSLAAEVLFGNTIQFNLPGLQLGQLRTTGTFVTIDSHPGARNNTPYGHRLYGQWILTSVIHGFTQDSYDNSLIASKPYTYT